MIWFAFLWSLARLNNFIFVCWPFIFVSYKQWFHLFFWGIARICVFYQICPDEADIQPSWLPRLQGMSSLAPSQKVDVLLTFSFWAAKQNILVNKTNSTTLHPLFSVTENPGLSPSSFSWLLCPLNLNDLLCLSSQSTEMPNLSPFLSSILCLPHPLPPSKWREEIWGKVFLKSSRPLMVFLKKLPPFSTTALQGTNRSCLTCRRRSSHASHCYLSRKTLFRILQSFNPFLLNILGLPRYSKIIHSVFLQLTLDSKI